MIFNVLFKPKVENNDVSFFYNKSFLSIHTRIKSTRRIVVIYDC